MQAISREQIERPLAVPDTYWRAFWGRADEVDGHWLWRDRPAVAVGEGPKALRVHPRMVAWAYDGQRPAKALAPACGEPKCIRPSHQRIGVAR